MLERRHPGLSAVRKRALRCLPGVLVALLAATPGLAAEFRSTAQPATVWYDAPSAKARRIYVVGHGYPVEVLVSLEGWTKVRDAVGSIGWVESSALAAKRMLVVRAKVAEVHTAPDAGAPLAFRVGQNVLLEWMETLPNGWTRVRHGEAGLGFVRTAEVFG